LILLEQVDSSTAGFNNLVDTSTIGFNDVATTANNQLQGIINAFLQQLNKPVKAQPQPQTQDTTTDYSGLLLSAVMVGGLLII